MKNFFNTFLFFPIKIVFFAILVFFPVLSWSMTESELDQYKINISNKCEDVKYQTDLIASMSTSILNWGSTLVNQGDITEQQYSSLLSKIDDINLRRNIINSKVNDIEDTLSYFTFTSSSSSNGFASCSWTTNDVFVCLSDLNGISTNVFAIYRILDNMYVNQYTLMGLVSTQEGLIRNIISSLSQIQSSLTSVSSSVSSCASYLSSIYSYFTEEFNVDFQNLLMSIYDVNYYVSELYNALNISGSDNYIRVWDLSNVSNNVENLAYLQSLSNILNRTNLMGFDRFRYYAQGQQLDQNPSLYPLSPYDSLQHAQNASIFDLISSGFSSSLISLGSLNNYLYWINKAVSSNNNETVEMYLSSMSNMLGRVDSYVVEDFSNEFFKLSSYLQTNSLTQISFSNSFDRLVSSIDTNTLYLSSISNDVSLIRDSITNIYESVTNIQGVTVRIGDGLFGSQQVLSDYDSEGTYFDYLTNRYLSVESENAPSNWFERVETLLAALVFSGTSTTNLTDTFENSSEFENSLSQIGEDSLFSDEQSNFISTAEGVGRSYVSISYELWHTLTSISKPSSISIGWGNSDSQGFESLANREFRVSFSTDQVDGFTELVHSMTTLIWLIVTMGIVWKGSFWLCRRIYSLYQVLHSLILSTWGHK